MCRNSYGESQPRIISKEQTNNNILFGDFSFPEFLCQNVTDKLVHQSGLISLCTLAGCWACSRDSLLVPVCEGFSSNRTAQTLADRSPYSSGFCTSTKFALQLLTSSKNWRKPPTGQPLGAALRQRKPFLRTTGPWEGERAVERAFGFPHFKKKERGGGAEQRGSWHTLALESLHTARCWQPCWSPELLPPLLLPPEYFCFTIQSSSPLRAREAFTAKLSPRKEETMPPLSRPQSPPGPRGHPRGQPGPGRAGSAQAAAESWGERAGGRGSRRDRRKAFKVTSSKEPSLPSGLSLGLQTAARQIRRKVCGENNKGRSLDTSIKSQQQT